ncbi:unnamed protein product [Mycena citricolor]|uniref:Zn(2)-C6 fungal-type domain-containing protein n=1 Tax=Mycena citricolor TaxID=2018698 RepID=A0AAD2GXT2_9AGAR|nr:unnamed protein product [Mycena citricolor]
MAHKNAHPDNVPGTLQRGKACLRCRKRKMRCDGAKPACQQCSRAKKGDACEYDDGKSKTRTQILRETIVRLEHRVRELEDPEYLSPAVALFDPHIRGFSESPPSSSYDSAEASFSHSPFPSDSAHSPEGSWCNNAVSPSPPLFSPELFFPDPEPQFQPPMDLAIMLLEIFSPHRHQCGLEIQTGELIDSLNRPSHEQRHPALMSAIFLWACFISRPELLSQHEEHYLALALDAVRDGLREGDSIVDIIRASCILSSYFLANGRLVEGNYHASAAAAMAVQCGLHTNAAAASDSDWFLDAGDELKPYKIDMKRGERILAFWQVYNLDRCWSVVLRKPVVIPETSINCPWPRDVAEYHGSALNNSVDFQTIKSFLEGDVSDDGYSMGALRSKASALFERAASLSVNWDSGMKSTELELAISSFITTLPSLHSSLDPEDKHLLIAVHTLAHTALISLHDRLASNDPVSYEQCSHAARACCAIITQLSETDFAYLDPILGHCWTSVAEVLLREIMTVNASWPPVSSDSIRNDLASVLYAMDSLSAKFPILGIAATKIQKRLPQL